MIAPRMRITYRTEAQRAKLLQKLAAVRRTTVNRLLDDLLDWPAIARQAAAHEQPETDESP